MSNRFRAYDKMSNEISTGSLATLFKHTKRH